MSIDISFFGSSGAIPDAESDSVFLAVRSSEFSALIDCGGSPILKLRKVNIDPLDLDVIILTHRHPDHIYGIPALFQSLGLMNRLKPLHIYGTEDVLNLIQVLVEIHELEACTRNIPLLLSAIPLEHNTLLLQSKAVAIRTTPVQHSVPTVALKFSDADSGKTVVYSSDTAPSMNLVRFADSAHLLIHEAGFPPGTQATGHSTPRQAGKVARLSRVKQLVLVHLPPSDLTGRLAMKEARREFEGQIRVPTPFETISLD